MMTMMGKIQVSNIREYTGIIFFVKLPYFITLEFYILFFIFAPFHFWFVPLLRTRSIIAVINHHRSILRNLAIGDFITRSRHSSRRD